MSKRALKKYLKSLKKMELEEQLLDLYNRFDEVKVFYNFVFNPKEDELVKDAKFKISKEYFPPNNRKPKTRRSVAQKLIKHFIKLGVDAHCTLDVMLFNIEVAQSFSRDRENTSEGFMKSMFRSYEQAFTYAIEKGVFSEFEERMLKIGDEAEDQKWYNAYQFEVMQSRSN